MSEIFVLFNRSTTSYHTLIGTVTGMPFGVLRAAAATSSFSARAIALLYRAERAISSG